MTCSEEEDREILIAHSDNGRLLLVIYSLCCEAIRIISARRLTLCTPDRNYGDVLNRSNSA